ncbi:aspartate/glutamate racemase family protein [Puniceibacterium confluentis]|uniref:aspartate/glutamate racemase family protein n=1 Tax=Puniceibacterium confluentis TaxID=1958944 RepID=UPI001FE39566|nr:aspartate/glutamate racemase family protein [Puniceibacterium confluentis]
MTPAPAPRVLLMNPNGCAATTRSMVAIAARTLAGVEGWTAPSSPPLLMTPQLVARASEQVAAAAIPEGVSGVIVSAFGDPGRAALAARLTVPVVGIGAAAAQAAAAGGRAYAVVTHTPALVPSIDALMQAAAPGGAYLGTFLADGDTATLSRNAQALDAALLRAMQRAHAAGARAVIIGGGPLGEAADRLRPVAPCALVAPIPEAARRLLTLLQQTT